MTDPLPSWNDTPTRQAIVRFVEEAAGDGRPGHVPPAERVAVFDNDGTLWCEKPMPIELGFILQRLAAMAEKDPALRDDPAREFDYVAGAEQALKEAAARGWTVVSIKRDWATVFGGT
jgi:hypothetical protein